MDISILYDFKTNHEVIQFLIFQAKKNFSVICKFVLGLLQKNILQMRWRSLKEKIPSMAIVGVAASAAPGEH